ncbi:hypothetical protein [Burkholderia contaminans]|uniref:hypothetical protein n=1 Tax=Burkholderia contaminans TaxID=488447 RepID=UPI002D801BE9|nr:hypothetical protein [Burkholderia contaminans]
MRARLAAVRFFFICPDVQSWMTGLPGRFARETNADLAGIDMARFGPVRRPSNH